VRNRKNNILYNRIIYITNFATFHQLICNVREVKAGGSRATNQRSIKALDSFLCTLSSLQFNTATQAIFPKLSQAIAIIYSKFALPHSSYHRYRPWRCSLAEVLSANLGPAHGYKTSASACASAVHITLAT
jgi:hypothetical protein